MKTALTVEILKHKLSTDQYWLERAVLAIWRRQTSDEQQDAQTKHLNGRGFNAVDAPAAARFVQWINRGNSLSGRHLARARTMMQKYTAQLMEVATPAAHAAAGVEA